MKQRLPRPKPPRPAGEPGRLAGVFARPQLGFYRMPELELRGGAVLTDGCRRILALSPQRICLDMGSTIVTVYGARLGIESYNGKRLTICGKVTGIDLADKWAGPPAPDRADGAGGSRWKANGKDSG